MNRTNYHTHTSRCHHAFGTDEDFVLEAIVDHYKTIGFSDHACWKYDSLFQPSIRMSVDDFPNYKQSIEDLRTVYGDSIEIRMGLEAEYFPKYMDWMLDFCIEQGIEYLIFGNHYYLTDELGIYFGYCSESYLEEYFRTCIEGMRTGMYSYLAHPELIMLNPDLEWDKQIEDGFHRICRTAKELDMPLEYNGLGMQANSVYRTAYPHPKFWQIASQYHNKAIIGMDAHKPTDLSMNIYNQALDELSKYDVEIVDEIPLVDFKKLKESRK
ncbi:histidinol-phosphatase [Catenisphaera adipataccumulans]|jgi:histidinol-phosphatase (PHP family)|uniref:Histidinol-phosphatase n=1 Tax=Catenisphaera adipataccumulans TaxID=700500 RepID=A0A7W8CYI5_9FIRM|nr:histidinol-phosphatase [Catenisphaera adipataccumulans]MBB5183943.1 histidinol-phosphatase (PHP family) [Catenisphaera adipataccumulans]